MAAATANKPLVSFYVIRQEDNLIVINADEQRNVQYMFTRHAPITSYLGNRSFPLSDFRSVFKAIIDGSFGSDYRANVSSINNYYTTVVHLSGAQIPFNNFRKFRIVADSNGIKRACLSDLVRCKINRNTVNKYFPNNYIPWEVYFSFAAQEPTIHAMHGFLKASGTYTPQRVGVMRRRLEYALDNTTDALEQIRLQDVYLQAIQTVSRLNGYTNDTGWKPYFEFDASVFPSKN